MSGRRAAAAAALCTLSAGLAFAGTGAFALAPPAQPHGLPSPSPAQPSRNAVMAAGTLLTVVLDEPLDARTASAGSLVKTHLEKPLELGGVTLAPAGAPGTLKIVAVRKPVAPDRDGSLELYLEPLALAGSGNLPLRSERDIFPSELKAGSILRARTGAAIDATNPAAIAIVTPPPFVTNMDPIHSDFTPIPLFTIAPVPPKRPKPTAAPTAAAKPSATPPPGA